MIIGAYGPLSINLNTVFLLILRTINSGSSFDYLVHLSLMSLIVDIRPWELPFILFVFYVFKFRYSPQFGNVVFY